jgi:flagellar operon protein
MTSIDIQTRIAAQNVLSSESIINQSSQGGSAAATGAGSFADVLSTAAAGQPVTFSGHAQTRLASRQITLSQQDLGKLSDALTRAAAKGSRSSLVLMDSAQGGRVGLVCSVPNRTVITAVDAQQMKDNIFTNIDSAMIV